MCSYRDTASVYLPLAASAKLSLDAVSVKFFVAALASQHILTFFETIKCLILPRPEYQSAVLLNSFFVSQRAKNQASLNSNICIRGL